MFFVRKEQFGMLPVHFAAQFMRRFQATRQHKLARFSGEILNGSESDKRRFSWPASSVCNGAVVKSETEPAKRREVNQQRIPTKYRGDAR
jgi:hypothetical protein